MLYDMISEKVQRENNTFEKRVSLLLPFLLVHNVTFDPHFLWAPPGADRSGGSGPVTGRLAQGTPPSVRPSVPAGGAVGEGLVQLGPTAAGVQ